MKTLIKRMMKAFGQSMDFYGNARLTLHNSLLDTNIDFEEKEKHTANSRLIVSK